MNENRVRNRMLMRLAENLALQTVLFWALTAVLTWFGFPFVLMTSVLVWAGVMAVLTFGWAIGHWLYSRE